MSLVNAVQENNRINNAKWSDWTNAHDIFSIYGPLDYSHYEVGVQFLNALIRDNGENLDIYMQAFDCLEYGQPFSRPELTT